MNPRHASTIVLLRARKLGGFEILMAKRSSQLKAFANLFVFPGGVSEEVDGPKEDMNSSKKCSLRELFEETGVLLTKSTQHKNASQAVFMDKEKKLEWQKAVHKDPKLFDSLLQKESVELPFAAMSHLITFITPVMEPRRFHTDFFVTFVDNAVHVQLDGTETVAFQWMSPMEAVKANEEGLIKFLPPQYFVLSNLAMYTDAAACVADIERENQENGGAVEILPHPVEMTEQVMCLAYPGDAEHPHFPGATTDRHRLHVKMPFGNGYTLQSTLQKRALTKADWALLTVGKM